MNRRENWMERLAEGLDLPAEPIPGQPIIEVVGDRRVLIEHHGGVTRFGRDRICVKVSFGQVSVDGCGLQLSRMTKEHLIICGRIDSVSLHRRERA